MKFKGINVRSLFPHGRSLPVLTDNSLNVAFAIKYFIYALFGISGVAIAVPSFAEVAGGVAALVLAAIVAVSASIASVAAFMHQKNTEWMKLEFYSSCVMVIFVGLYSGSLIYLSITGDANRINLAIIATALLVMPIWRLRFLYKNTQT